MGAATPKLRLYDNTTIMNTNIERENHARKKSERRIALPRQSLKRVQLKGLPSDAFRVVPRRAGRRSPLSAHAVPAPDPRVLLYNHQGFRDSSRANLDSVNVCHSQREQCYTVLLYLSFIVRTTPPRSPCAVYTQTNPHQHNSIRLQNNTTRANRGQKRRLL